MDLSWEFFYLCFLILGILLLYKIRGGSSIVYSITFFFMAIFSTIAFIGNVTTEKIPIWNAKTTIATISYLADEIKLDREYDDFVLSIFSRHGRRKEFCYTRDIEYSYIVNGVKYIISDKLKSRNMDIDELKNISTDTIEITYNTQNPSDVIIGNNSLNTTDILNIITIIAFVGMGAFFLMLNNTQKKSDLDNGYTVLSTPKIIENDIFLKVLSVQNIDYEREKVFFESQDNCIYYYETDFGEEFKEGQTYKIKLNRHKQKKINVEYEAHTIKAIRIINTEKREFINVE